MVASVDLRNVVKDFASGVTIVTSVAEDGTPVGATVSAFCSLSLDPPLVLVCLNAESRTAEAIQSRGAYAVHFLDESQSALALKFANSQGGKFDDTPFDQGELGLPVLRDCRIRLECLLHAELPGGDHGIFVGRVVNTVACDDFKPLLHGNRHFGAMATL